MSPWRVFSQKGLRTGISSSPQHQGLSILGSQSIDPEQLQKDFGCCCASGICVDTTTMYLPPNYRNTSFFGWFPQAPGHTYENPQVQGSLELPIEIFFNYAPDSNCVEYHENGPGGRSFGTFECYFDLPEMTTVYYRVEGDTETQDENFDKSSLTIAFGEEEQDTVSIRGFSYRGGCRMLFTWAAGSMTLDSGRHYYKITTDTTDGLYHPASYHKFTIKEYEGEDTGEYRPPKNF